MKCNLVFLLSHICIHLLREKWLPPNYNALVNHIVFNLIHIHVIIIIKKKYRQVRKTFF